MFGIFGKKQPVVTTLTTIKKKELDRSWSITICKDIIAEIIFAYIGLDEGKKLSKSSLYFETSLTKKLILAKTTHRI